MLYLNKKATLACMQLKDFLNVSQGFFSHADKKTVLKEIKKLNLNKAVQDSDIPVKVLKENALLITLISNLMKL